MTLKIDPVAAGLDESRLDRIRDHLARSYVDAGKIAGCSVAVARDGHVGYYEEIGQRDRERGLPVTEDTIWRIYSMTKPITGVALMTLYERGVFQLDDPVHRWIPEWRDLKVKERAEDGTERLVEPLRPMSVRDALMHMTGFGMSTLSLRTDDKGRGFLDSDATLETFCQGLATENLDHQPGTRWIYGVSTDICARLVEVMSGQRFDDYLRTTIFEPLGMPDTAFHVPDDKVGRFAASYGRARDKSLRLLEDPEQSAYRRQRTFLSGGGGLVSTMPDYLRFTQMLLNGGELEGTRILGRKTVELMTMNHLPGGGDMTQFALPGGYGEVGFAGMGFGLTMAVSLGPVQTGQIGSAGDYMWGGMASTTFWCDPAEDLLVVFMTQLIPSGTFNFRGQLKSLVYPTLL
ncbi:serine hydrolase domain-containing protein [Actinomarinicola tropica]|uniref:Serine hydrolase n=1 Tax=Actinomarinicola tropica TaxID=2789776 RepID=A0A5Q2RL84_9ACTN|nr:serine hydrolase [Actinomarinicola tropica]QGG96603.1 serine hydrolase [Actinomarinicola tropica]